MGLWIGAAGADPGLVDCQEALPPVSGSFCLLAGRTPAGPSHVYRIQNEGLRLLAGVLGGLDLASGRRDMPMDCGVRGVPDRAPAIRRSLGSNPASANGVGHLCVTPGFGP